MSSPEIKTGAAVGQDLTLTGNVGDQFHIRVGNYGASSAAITVEYDKKSVDYAATALAMQLELRKLLGIDSVDVSVDVTKTEYSFDLALDVETQTVNSEQGRTGLQQELEKFSKIDTVSAIEGFGLKDAPWVLEYTAIDENPGPITSTDVHFVELDSGGTQEVLNTTYRSEIHLADGYTPDDFQLSLGTHKLGKVKSVSLAVDIATDDAGDTITRGDGGSWVADGFVTGDQIRLSGDGDTIDGITVNVIAKGAGLFDVEFAKPAATDVAQLVLDNFTNAGSGTVTDNATSYRSPVNEVQQIQLTEVSPNDTFDITYVDGQGNSTTVTITVGVDDRATRKAIEDKLNLSNDGEFTLVNVTETVLTLDVANDRTETTGTNVTVERGPVIDQLTAPARIKEALESLEEIFSVADVTGAGTTSEPWSIEYTSTTATLTDTAGDTIQLNSSNNNVEFNGPTVAYTTYRQELWHSGEADKYSYGDKLKVRGLNGAVDDLRLAETDIEVYGIPGQTIALTGNVGQTFRLQTGPGGTPTDEIAFGEDDEGAISGDRTALNIQTALNSLPPRLSTRSR